MKTFYNYLLILLLVPAFAMASHGKGKYKKVKEIHKEFTVNPNAVLNIDNKFGDIDLISWNENRTEIQVTIITYGNDEEKTQERLDNITVDFKASASSVSAKTIFNHQKNNWKWWNHNKNVKIEVNYTVKFPVSNNINIDNDYGSVLLNNLDGDATINCDYGQLILGNLNSENNQLNFDYTSKSTIDYLKSGKINADYSTFTIKKTEELVLGADYTNSEIVEAQKIRSNCDYGKIIIGKVNYFKGEGNYLNYTIDEAQGELNINTDFGAIRINELTETASNLTINSQYTNIKIGINSKFHFNFDVSLKYANLKEDAFLNIQHSTENNYGSNKTFQGNYGDNNTNHKITIHSEFGNVLFTKI
ncbi:MAG: hypothetical protein ACWA45_00670 [Flavobacteriales bacterium]